MCYSRMLLGTGARLPVVRLPVVLLWLGCLLPDFAPSWRPASHSGTSTIPPSGTVTPMEASEGC